MSESEIELLASSAVLNPSTTPSLSNDSHGQGMEENRLKHYFGIDSLLNIFYGSTLDQGLLSTVNKIYETDIVH